MKKYFKMVQMLWKESWEPIVALIGFMITLLSTTLSPWINGVIGVISFFLLVGLILSFYKAFFLFSERHVPLIVLVGKDEQTADSMWKDVLRAMEKWHFNDERFRREFDIERPDIFIHDKNPLQTANRKWIQICKSFRRHLEQLNNKLEGPGRRIYHVFINGPSALAVGLGAACGTKYEMIIHQWDPGMSKMSYFPVANFTRFTSQKKHGLHDLVDPASDEFRYIMKAETDDATDQVAVSVFIAKDNPHPEVKCYLTNLSPVKEIPVVEINQLQKRRLDQHDDWIRCAKEILTVIREQFSNVKRDRLHLFLSAPVALAFMIGMGLAYFQPITVYNWWPKEKSYYPVIPLEYLARTVSS